MTTSAQAPPSLKEAVDQTRREHVAAVNAGDAEAAAKLFSPNAVFLPPGQPALERIPAIQAWFTHVFAQFNVNAFDLQPAGIEQIGELTIEHGNWQATFQPKDRAQDLPAGGTYLTVYGRLSDGSVRMIRDTFNGLPA